MKDAGTKERFVELRAQGVSYQNIATELGISKQTALNWASELYSGPQKLDTKRPLN